MGHHGCSPDSTNDIYYEYTDANILVDSVFERCELEDLTLVLHVHTHTQAVIFITFVSLLFSTKVILAARHVFAVPK